MNDSHGPRRERLRVRWSLLGWPVGLVVVLAAAVLGWIWSTERLQRQDHVVPTMLVAGLAAMLIVVWALVWLLFFSRLRWKVRLGAGAVALALFAGGIASLEVRGVSGDVVPLLGWRWSTEAVAPSPPPEAPTSIEALLTGPHDFPQFQGPSRDGSVPGVRLAREWPDPPRNLWRHPVGSGWSGFAVAGDFAVTVEQRGDLEVVSCYRLATGEPVWTHEETTRWEDPLGGPGPRATPAIDAGRVYALGGTGMLQALDLATGERYWSVDVLQDTGASAPTYGVSASPLVLDDVVIVAAGGRNGHALVGYDTRTGERRWSGGNGRPAYGSPRHAVLAGVPQILVLNADDLASHDPSTGAVLWQYPWPSGSEETFQPVVLPGDRVFVSTGYGVGGKLLRVRDSGAGLEVELLWESLGLKAKFTNVVHHEGFLYGLDDGILVCLDPADGSRRWKRGRYGHGQILLVGDLLVVLSERGDVALVEARSDEHRELGRFPALAGKTWNHPALAGSLLLVRNDREAACFELPLEGGRVERPGIR